MYALIFIVLFGGISAFLARHAENLLSTAWGFHDRARAHALASAAPEIERFYRLTGCLPAAFSDFTSPATGSTACAGQVKLTSPGAGNNSLSGFEQDRENLDPVNNQNQFNNLNAWDYLASTTTPVTDGIWKFNRLALYALDPRQAAGDMAFVSNYTSAPGSNWELATSCNVNASASLGGLNSNNLTWCGDLGSWWWRFDEKQLFPSMLAHQRAWQQRTLGKIAAVYNTLQAWPILWSSTTSSTLASQVSAPSTLANCSQPYIWHVTGTVNGVPTQVNVPLDCTDLYNLWGNPVSYNFKPNTPPGRSTLYLLSETGIPDPSGKTPHLYVTSELSL